MTSPTVQQHHPRAAVAPVPHDEFVGAATQRNFFGLRDDGQVFGIDPSALRCEKQPERQPARERHTEPLQNAKKCAQPPLQLGSDSRNHASKYWFAALFHDP